MSRLHWQEGLAILPALNSDDTSDKAGKCQQGRQRWRWVQWDGGGKGGVVLAGDESSLQRILFSILILKVQRKFLRRAPAIEVAQIHIAPLRRLGLHTG